MGGTTLLSDLQMAVMRILWTRGEATVAEVHEALTDARGLAPTTVATVLSRLERRRLVDHRRQGRQFVYRTLVTDQDVRRSAIDELTERVFQGDVAGLVSQLLDVRDMSSGDLARVKAMIETREKALDEPPRGTPDDDDE